ncbi:uncharacterized protein PGTG_01819 [Puccinia graminis f. sp. tritici CRL 75-36-700-3]|uniref:Uncharacterized protein n=1 Tax=Puccinia graminis f. sp. tritici (strain CRL 75-36-700-3 / race SCCL) TaxID=418459 RepID=E3JTF2_PUCGT|nr:uncharacterized protein PGTG_01819 [Puccinia graminis f. sp. tritici CRL 75-36-700-3]EFP75226.2 hypothetical protein PGTG_01819 [Puccinia graminis f. sp. tritici CRL 75-36-700-3]
MSNSNPNTLPKLTTIRMAFYFALRCILACAQPGHQGLGEIPSIASDLYSIPEDLYSAHNLKRPLEHKQAPDQPDFSGVGTRGTNLVGHRSDYEAVNPQNDVMTKRQKTAQNGYGSRIPQSSLGPHVLSPGVTLDEAFPGIEFEGIQNHRSGYDLYELASFSSASTSPSSFLRSPSHSILQNGMGFTFEKQHSIEPTPESMFESMSDMSTDDDDLKMSKLLKQLQSPEFENFDTQHSSSLLQDDPQVHPHLPQLELFVGEDQAHFQVHPPIRSDPHDGVTNRQIQHPDHQVEDHSGNQGIVAPGNSHAQYGSKFFGQLNENRQVSSEASLNQDQAEVSNESLQVNNSDEGENVHESEDSTLLNKGRFLGRSINDRLLASFTKKFDYHMMELFAPSSSTSNRNDHPIHGLTTRMSRKGNSYIIRIGSARKVRPGSEPTQPKAQKGRKLYSQFVDLIKWLLFINTAVLRNLDATHTLNHSELNYHQKLIAWLFEVAFQPRNSAPVLGRISCDALNAFKPGEEFGPIQRILIEFLSLPQNSDVAIQPALSLIRLYYEEFKPEIYKELGNLNAADFDSKIRSLVADGIHSHMKVGSSSDFVVGRQKLGNFAIFDLEKFPQTMKPRSYQVIHELRLGKKEGDILNYFERTFSDPRTKEEFSDTFGLSSKPDISPEKTKLLKS